MISVIIPTCHRNDHLAKCLDLLKPDSQTLDKSLYEIIVTDDGIEDTSKKLIEQDYPWVNWIEGPKKGPASNRNNGAKHAKGLWLIFIDDDCQPSSDLLKEYYNEILKGNSLAVEGSVSADKNKQRFDEEAPINLSGGCFWSCNIAVNKILFDKLNGFDESFPYPAMEDIDFFERVKRHTDIIFLRDANVVHPWRRVKPFNNFSKHLKSHKYYAKKYNIYCTKDYRWQRIKIFFGNSFLDLICLLRFSFRGWKLYFEKCYLNFCLIFI